jgi:hypothetical protein
MAVTLSVVRRSVVGNSRLVTVDVTGPASYTTGGESLTTAQFSLLFPEIAANAATADWTQATFVDSETMFATVPAFLSGIIAKATGKFVFLTAGAQTAGATNLSAQTVRIQINYQYTSG